MDSDRNRQDDARPDPDANALEEFVTSKRKDLERRVLRAGIPPEDCADVVQEALTTAFDQLKRGLFRHAGSIATWVYVILGGEILDYW